MMIKDGTADMHTNKQKFARKPTLYRAVGEKCIIKTGNSTCKNIDIFIKR